jgi:antitoxin CptB
MSQKLRWACRRGMRELDLPLQAYLAHCYPTALEDEQIRFEWLLEQDDLEIWNFLFREEAILPPDLRPLILRIRPLCTAP